MYNQDYSLGERQKRQKRKLTFYENLLEKTGIISHTQNKQKIKEGIFQRKQKKTKKKKSSSSLLLLNNDALPHKKKDQTTDRSLNDDDKKMTTLMQMPDGRLIRKYS